MKTNTDPKQQKDFSSGRDEMNLAEFPFAKLNAKDSREIIEYEGWTVNGSQRLPQKWIVRGASGLGLPSEFGERLLMALIALTAEDDFASRKVTFSVGELIRRLDLAKNQRYYELIEQQLDRLMGVTIHSENAFWDHAKQKRVTTKRAFHLIEKLWLRFREGETEGGNAENVRGYIIWSDEIWRSFKAGYIKSLDLAFFYGLPTPISRRLYRFLDKRMRYQEVYEIDIFDLANRLGCVRYKAPSQIKRILEPAYEALIEHGFLAEAKLVKRGKYTRLRFVKRIELDPQAEAKGLEAESQATTSTAAARHDEAAIEADGASENAQKWLEVLEQLR
ncbi:MAG TPA: replication initiator protein A [Anaerolineae bacterium]|nr:replication initiator protein A [Anaerolineae bacterium]